MRFQMVRNILIIISFIGFSFVAQAQAKKLYIINQAHETAVKQSADPVQTIQQIDRVEMDVANADNSQSSVLVKRCGSGGCQSALNNAVQLNEVIQANATMASRPTKEIAASECRVCVAPTASDLGTYIKDLNSTLKGMGALK